MYSDRPIQERKSTHVMASLVTSFFCSNFDKLAHGPRGTEAKQSLYVYRFQPADGSLVLLNIAGNPLEVLNPAFSRYHPHLNVVYTCTEDIENNGKVFAFRVGPNGELTQLGEPVDAGGTSTCYITIDRACKHMLLVNYWDSTLAVIPLSKETGEFTGPIKHMYDPKEGKKVVASGRCKGGVNHSNNDDSTIRMRQADPHSHALVLDPYVGTVAYVPDLGKDLVREFYYNREAGKIEMELNVMPSGLCTGHPDGPRYLSFHPKYNIAYVVNELSSTVAVFEVDKLYLQEVAAASARGDDMTRFKGRSSLRLVQSIKTIPSAFPTTMNTCGRICVHKSGSFVVVSNRGHQSIAIFRVITKGPKRGELYAVGHFHTRGETPRHFQFDASGQFLLVANQDTDSLAVFSFNLSSGVITYTGNKYRVPSPNFVCCCPLRGDDNDFDFDTPSDVLQVTSATPTFELSNIDMVKPGNLIESTFPKAELQTYSDCLSATSENSCTMPATLAIDIPKLDETNSSSNTKLELELVEARKEIELLKQQLLAIALPQQSQE
jgi:6-phosphogluconolactonase